MRRAQKDYEDKAMASRQPPPREPSKPASSGPPVDVRPSEREAVEQAEEAQARPSERELAEAAAAAAEAQQEAAEAKEPDQP